jgi:chemotaxis protein methyltransferase CheR
MLSDVLSDFIHITEEEFKLISGLVYDKFGINLTDKKKTLVTGRLNKILKGMGFKNFKDYYDFVINDSSNYSLLLLIDKISTNHSYFFREPKHFDFLARRLMPEFAKRNTGKELRDIRVWCAGCASGEEAYTLAMLFDSFLYDHPGAFNPMLLATDISMSSLENAVRGIYGQYKLKDVPVMYRHKYFEIIDENNVKINDVLRKYIMFKRLNFMREKFPFKNQFDAIFCRNVMIYFDNDTKNRLVGKFYDMLKPGGHLFIGHSESIRNDESQFRYVEPAVYRK